MTGMNDRPVTVLDRTSVLASTAGSYVDHSRSTLLDQVSQPDPDHTRKAPATTGLRAERGRGASKPIPRGWGSHEERRLMRWGMAGFLMLATYAVVFVLIGALVWT